MGVLEELHRKGLIKPPPFVLDTHYEVMMGSVAYGVSTDTSDIDIYGFCIPPKKMVFPHLAGEIDGFGRQKQRFEQFQQHHIACDEKNYDLSIFSIVKYFSLCMDNNPNMIDSLFVPEFCVLKSTKIGNMIRDNRRIFLHKGSWFKFKGYSYSQMRKMENKVPEGKRKEGVERYGFDTKYAYHLVRLLNEVEMILTEHDLDLLRNREQLKSIRAGGWTLDQVREYFYSKERELETLYTQSVLRHSPDEGAIKALLLACLEEHYGSVDVVIEGEYERAVAEIKRIVSRL